MSEPKVFTRHELMSVINQSSGPGLTADRLFVGAVGMGVAEFIGVVANEVRHAGDALTVDAIIGALRRLGYDTLVPSLEKWAAEFA